MWDTPVPWLCLHWSVQASGGRREAGRWCIKACIYWYSQALDLVHVWYLSDAHVKVFVVYSTGDRLRPVELQLLLHRHSWGLVTIVITGHLRWNLQPWSQTYCSCLTVLIRLRNVWKYLSFGKRAPKQNRNLIKSAASNSLLLTVWSVLVM